MGGSGDSCGGAMSRWVCFLCGLSVRQVRGCRTATYKPVYKFNKNKPLAQLAVEKRYPTCRTIQKQYYYTRGFNQLHLARLLPAERERDQVRARAVLRGEGFARRRARQERNELVG